MQSQIQITRLAVLGVGYMGGSAALAARRAGLVGSVAGYDANPAVWQAALRMGIIDAVAGSPREAVREADLVLLAAPVGCVEGVLREIAPALASHATVIDLGSVKASRRRLVKE